MRVLTMGTFDLLHPGHLHLFRQCRDLAGAEGVVHAAVNQDGFVERYKGRRPVMGQDDRMAMVQALALVDAVGLNTHDENALPTIDRHKPDVIAIGEDWYGRDYHAQLGVRTKWLFEHRIFIAYLPLLEGYSSTALREAMA